MNKLARLSVTAAPEAALKKLKKQNVPLYNCKTEGARFIFCVKDEDIKKVFAIFQKPCYNVCVVYESRRARLKKGLLNRVGLLVGAVLFAALALFSNTLVLKISVTGSGSYLSPEVKRIVYEMGVKEFSPYRSFDAPAATGKILALPQVTFCNIQKRGAILQIDVQVDEEHFGSFEGQSLTSDRAGVVKKIVTVCGTPLVEEGASVNAGDELIGAFTYVNEKRVDCVAVGYAEILCAASCEYFAAEQSEENLKAALASVNMYADSVEERKATVAEIEGGVKYVIDFTYLHKLSINFN